MGHIEWMQGKIPVSVLFGNGNGRNIDRESADDEESETGFGEHRDGECRKRERMRKAPGLKLERLEKGTGESCTAAEESRERTSNLLSPTTVRRGGGLVFWSINFWLNGL